MRCHIKSVHTNAKVQHKKNTANVQGTYNVPCINEWSSKNSSMTLIQDYKRPSKVQHKSAACTKQHLFVRAAHQAFPERRRLKIKSPEAAAPLVCDDVIASQFLMFTHIQKFPTAKNPKYTLWPIII